MAAKKATAKDLSSKINKLYDNYMSIDKPEFVKSGSVVFDALLGGGIPKGTFILWSAQSGIGKSTASLHMSRVYCMQGKKVLYLDYEGGVNKPQLEGIGLTSYMYDKDTNPNGTFFIFQVQTFKDAEKILDDIMEDIDLVVFDSAASMNVEKDRDSSVESAEIGTQARAMTKFLRKYKVEARRTGCTWIIINQIRQNIGAMGFGAAKTKAAGGDALKFFTDIWIETNRSFGGKLERFETTMNGEEKVPFGAICDIYTSKNRYARPMIKLRIAIIFGKGISNEYAYLDFLQSKGRITTAGAWTKIKLFDEDEEEAVLGQASVIDWVYDNKDRVRKYIESCGGYRLLLEEGEQIDISDTLLANESVEAEILNSDIVEPTEEDEELIAVEVEKQEKKEKAKEKAATTRKRKTTKKKEENGDE